MTDKIQLVVVRNPFDRRSRDERCLKLNIMPSVAAMVQDYLPLAPALSVSINGELITRDEWESRTLRPGDQMVVMPVVHGGDSKILGAFLMIALIVVAPYAAGYADIMMGGAFGAAGSIGLGMLTYGIMAAGAVVIQGLLAPGKPPSSPSSSSASQAFGWNPATTQTPGGVIARAYGTNKLYGNVIAGYINSSDSNSATSGTEDQMAHLLIDLGTGPYSALYDFMLNDQPIGNYTGITVTARMGNLNQAIIPAFNDTYATYSVGGKVVMGSPIIRATQGTNYDALEVIITAPNGLWHANSSGGMDNVDVQIAIEITDDNGATWNYVATEPNTVTMMIPGHWSIGHWVRYKYGRHYRSRWVETGKGSLVKDDHVEGAVYSRTPYPQKIWHWVAIPEPVAITLNNSVTLSGASTRAIRRSFRMDNLSRGTQYQIRCTNLSADQTSSLYSVGVYLSEINEIIYDDFTYPRTVLVGIDALATSQLSGSIKFSCTADCAIVQVWNGAAWVSQWSNNPAWVTWDILTQPVLDDNFNVARYDGLDPSRLILSGFIAWAAFCDTLVSDSLGGTEKRCEYDGIFDTLTSLWDAALQVCASARAQLVIRGTNIAVVYDDVRAAPVQLFSVGNTSVSGFSETYLPMQDRAASIEVNYLNAQNGYARDTLTVVNTNISESIAARTQINLAGVTRSSQAWREANYRLARNEILRRTATISVDIDALACTVGDLIWLQSDITQWGIGGRAESGSTTINLVLDQPVTLIAGKTYELKLRLDDDTLLTRAITTAAGTVSSVDVSVAFPSAPTLYNPWAIGETGKAIKEFIVMDIARSSDQVAKLTLIEYNVTLYGLDNNIPALPSPNISFAILPTVSNIRYVEVMALTSGNIVVVHLDMYFDFGNAESVRIYENGQLIGESNLGVFRRENVHAGIAYRFTLRPIDSIGLSPASTWLDSDHIAVGLLAAPADLSGLVVQSGSALDVLSWTQSPDIDVRYGGNILVRHSPWVTGAVWESSTSACYPLPGTSTGVSLPLRAGTYFIKAEDSSGKQSLNAAQYISNGNTSFTFTPAGTAQVNPQEDPGFPGIFTNTYHDLDVGNTIELVGSTLFDDGLDFDTGSSFDYTGGVTPSGQYVFAASTDLGAVKSARLTATLSVIAENVLSNFDDGLDFDSGLNFDNTAGAPVDAWIETRSTNDDPAVTPIWSAWQRLAAANFTARAFQYRAQLTSADPTYNISIDQLRVKVESL